MAQLTRRFGGNVNFGEDGPDNSMAVAMVTVFVLLMIFFALMIVWLVLSIYLSLKGSIPNLFVTSGFLLYFVQLRRRLSCIHSI